jgi:glucose/arabinose dehydrogenase
VECVYAGRRPFVDRVSSSDPLIRRALLLIALAAVGAGLLSGEVATVAAHEAHCTKPDPADTVGDALQLRKVGSFAGPTYVTGAPGDSRRLFVVERAGRIRVVISGRKLRRPFLDLSSEVLVGPDSEQGLFSIAFAPDYRRTRAFYVFFSDRDGDVRVKEFKRSRRSVDRADARSGRTVLFAEHSNFRFHYGGQLQFGPDRLLYIGMGVGEHDDDAHNLGTLLGKILRIDPRRRGRRSYSVPAGNPFIGVTGARPEIYLYGLRNPWRFSFDRLTGDLAVGDVGNLAVEEVDFLRRGRARAPRGGRNLGWPTLEGSFRRREGAVPNYLPPLLERLHPHAQAITGGYVVRDRALGRYYGRYVYGDFCEGDVRSVVLRYPQATEDDAEGLDVPFLSSFGEDTRGRLYAMSLMGSVYRIRPR